MKKRKFADGGEVTEGQNPNIDDETRARAMKFVADNAATKPRTVTKEELAKSGLSLRDYMNKQQGLVRRSTPYSGTGGSGGGRGPSAAEMAPALTREERMERIPRDKGEPAVNPITGSDLSRNISNTLNATAGLKGVQMGQMAAEAAMGSRAGAAARGLMGGKPVAEVRQIEPTMSNVSAAKRAELAGELRRGAQPTKFTSPSKPTASKRTRKFNDDEASVEMKKGGAVKKYAAGGAVSSRADGIAQRGKTRGKVC